MPSLKKNFAALEFTDEDLRKTLAVSEAVTIPGAALMQETDIAYEAPPEAGEDNTPSSDAFAYADLPGDENSEEPTVLGNLSLAAVLLEDEVRDATWMFGEDAARHCIRAARNVLKAALQQERLLARQRARLAELEKAVNTDILTGLLNRRGFESELSRILSSARRFEEKGVLVYIDLDSFKPVNDTYGHAAGDEILRRVADILRKNVRKTDCVGRVGGDEFAVVLTRTDHHNGIRCAQGLDTLLNTAHITWQGKDIPLKASLGYHPYGPDDEGADILHHADTAMYRTKRTRASKAARPIGQFPKK